VTSTVLTFRRTVAARIDTDDSKSRENCSGPVNHSGGAPESTPEVGAIAPTVGVVTAPAVLGQAAGDRWLHPSPRLATLRLAEAGGITVLLLLAVGLPLLMTGLDTAAAIAGAGILLAGIVVAVLLVRRVRSWAFCERTEDLLIRRGVMVQRLSLVPYGRMQFVDVSAGPLERSLGLATLRLHTAAAASDARIPGLPRAEAERLRDQLGSLGEAQAAGL
jgi:membrane protein YdbS with pleckstrin-like domain